MARRAKSTIIRYISTFVWCISRRLTTVNYSPTFDGDKVCLTLRGLLYNQQRKANKIDTTHNSVVRCVCCDNSQHTTRWAAALPSSGLFPSISKGISTMPPTLCAMDSYISVNGAMHWVRSGRSLFPCFGHQYCTHQKIERGMGPRPQVAAVWSKKHNNQPKVGKSNSRECGEEMWQGRSVWGGVVSLFGHQTEQQKKKKRGSKNALALGGRRFTIETNNQPIFGGSGRWNARGCVGGAGRVGGVQYHCFGAGTPSNTKQQKNNTLWP